MSFKPILSIFAATLILFSCGDKGPETPQPPVTPSRPVNPKPSEPEKVVARYYFTQAYAGLYAGESTETELRVDGKKYDLAGNAAQVKFTTDNAAVATVNANGRITAVGVGQTVVTAMDKDKSYAEINVRVYPEDFPKYKNPAGDEVPILAWYAKLSAKSEFSTMRQCGFNLALIAGAKQNDEILNNLKGTKVKAIMSGLDPNTYKDCEELAMYNIYDEPSTDNATLNELKKQFDYYQKADKNHSAYLNFSPHDSDTFINALNILPLNFLSYDHYPIRNNGLRSEYYSELFEARKAANIMAVPFWSFTNSVEHKDYPTPKIEHLRFQLFADMVFGVQGFQFFTYTVPVGDDAGTLNYVIGPLDKNGNTTQIWLDCQTVISEIKAYMNYLLGAQSLWIGGSLDSHLKEGLNSLPYPLTKISVSSGNYVVSHSCNEGHEYILVFNASYTTANTINLTFSAPVGRINLDGSLSTVSGATSVSLSAGNIAIFKIN